MQLRIDGQTFRIDPSQDTDALRVAVLDASHRAGYVHFLAVGGGQVSVLVGSRTSASFEVHEHETDEASWSEEDARAADDDYAAVVSEWEQSRPSMPDAA
jgi:hypothetical protein